MSKNKKVIEKKQYKFTIYHGGHEYKLLDHLLDVVSLHKLSNISIVPGDYNPTEESVVSFEHIISDNDERFERDIDTLFLSKMRRYFNEVSKWRR